MKTLTAVMSGFILTLGTFSAGVVSAVALLDAEPVPVRTFDMEASGLWTAVPARIDTASQDFKRLPAQAGSVATDMASADEAPPEGIVADTEEVALVDPTTTASTAAEAVRPESASDPSMNAAHLEWCSERYRSYRPETNSYTPYSGGQRECVSPFLDGSSVAVLNSDETESYVEESVARKFAGYAAEPMSSGYHLPPDHIQSCFARYRSYRPEDNTFQPYGGGPRRQCR